MKHSVQVTVLGQQYTLRSEASEEQVHRVADFVNHKIEEVRGSGKSVDTLNTAILALLNVSGAYLSLKDSGSLPAEAEQRLQNLLGKLEAAL